MNSLSKVLVVDNGEREPSDQLAVELAGLGLSSVTTTFEAADEVLGLIARPSAIFLKVPQRRHSIEYANYLKLADELKRAERTSGVPLIVWDRAMSLDQGRVSAILSAEIGLQALAEPEL